MMKLQRRFKDLGIGGITARWYDNNTRKNRLAEMKAYAKEAAKHIQDGCSVLEVAPGPGYLAIELAKLGKYKIIGLDISNDFVEIARRNVKETGVEVEFRQGSVADIPFQDNMFDFIICTAAFKNFKEPFKALSEIYRVLMSGGTALIIDMNRKVSNQQIEVYTKNMDAKNRDKLFMKLIFKYFLRNGAYTKDEFINLISRTAFKEYDIKEEGVGFNIYLRKGNPVTKIVLSPCIMTFGFVFTDVPGERGMRLLILKGLGEYSGGELYYENNMAEYMFLSESENQYLPEWKGRDYKRE